MEPRSDEELFSDGPTESTEVENGPGRKRVARLLRHFALLSLLAAVCLIGRQRPSWYEAVRYRQGSQLWAPPEWHKDAEGNDVKDTWDHYQMPNCDSGPPPNAKKKVIVGPKIALRKMKEKLKLPKLKIEAVRKMKDVLDLTDPQPQLFATDTLRLRRLRHEVDEGDEPDALPPKLAAVRDLKDGRVHIKYVPVKRTRAQQICAEHIAIASADHAQMIKAHAAFEAHRKAIRGLHYWQGTHRCGIQFYNTDFPAKITWRDDRGHESPAHCQQACTWNHDCEGFSWSKWGCFLKKTPKLPENEKRKNSTRFIHKFVAGVYSGHPCNQKESPYPWINDPFQKHNLPKPKAYHPAKNASMFCTMLILPYSYEVDLTIMQHQNYYSIFMCEHWQIYSSQPMQLAPRLTTRLVNTSQVAEAAGQWGTALNTEAFVAYWRALILDGDYLKAKWLIKVDPDTVWFPHRLVPLLMETEQHHSLEAPGIYLNNCPQGLHGPIEILSQTAFSTLAEVSPKCFWSMNNWGNWQWGEDMWLDQCFLTVGHAKRIYVPKMLAEDHCNNWPGWRSCEAEDIVAFHPFKNAEQYIQCTGKSVTTSTTRTATQTTTATATTQTTTVTLRFYNPMEKVENFFGNIFHH